MSCFMANSASGISGRARATHALARTSETGRAWMVADAELSREADQRRERPPAARIAPGADGRPPATRPFRRSPLIIAELAAIHD
jgi:predicted ATPase